MFQLIHLIKSRNTGYSHFAQLKFPYWNTRNMTRPVKNRRPATRLGVMGMLINLAYTVCVCVDKSGKANGRK